MLKDKAEDKRQIGSFIDSMHDISVQAGVVQNSQIGYPKNRTITDYSISIFEIAYKYYLHFQKILAGLYVYLAP